MQTTSKIIALFSPALLLALPTTPSNLQLTPLSAHSVQISWQSNTNDNKGYKIFRDGILVTRISDSDTQTFTDTGLQANTQYTYTVKATDDETPQTIQDIVDRHNYYRNLVFTDSPISWKNDLADHAQAWANYLALHYTQADRDAGEIPHATRFQTNQHTEDNYAEGENIAWSSTIMPYTTSEPVDISDVAVADAFPFGAVDAWASEKAYYDYENNTQKAGYENKAIGHYTQVAWQRTSLIGCAKAKSQTDISGEWVVCRYEAQGNFNDEKPYCTNYTVNDLYTNVTHGFTTSMIDGKAFSITKVFENRTACTRTDKADSSLTFTGATKADIPQFNVFNTADNSNLWDMNFDNITIDAEGKLIMTNEANDRYMELKLIGEDATSYSVEAYWWVSEPQYNRHGIIKLIKQ